MSLIRAYREDFFRKLISVHCTFIRDLRVEWDQVTLKMLTLFFFNCEELKQIGKKNNANILCDFMEISTACT